MNTSQNPYEPLIKKVFEWLGRENVIWFKHVKGLKGRVDTVLKLNFKRKGIPAHPIHFREGMQIRNFLRKQEECKEWDDDDLDNTWAYIIEQCIKLL